MIEKALMRLLECNKIAGNKYHPRYKRGREGGEVSKSPLKPVIILERIIAILRSYLVNEEVDEVERVQVVTSKILNPEIIITESYT